MAPGDCGGLPQHRSRPPYQVRPGSPASDRGVARRGRAMGHCVCTCCSRRAKILRSAGRSCVSPALLVAQVVADDHDPAVTADHLALVADLLDARLDLHGSEVLRVRPPPHGMGAARSTCSGRRSAAGQVVRRQLHHDPVIGKDTDVVHPHLAADVREDLVTVLKLHLEHRVRQRLDDGALDLDGPLFFGHASPFESATWTARARADMRMHESRRTSLR